MSQLILLLLALPAAAQSTHHLEHDGERRLYLLDAPAKSAGKLPVIIALHGGGGSAEGMRRKTRLSDYGGGKEFIAVHPQGIARQVFGKTLATWNAGSCCGPARERGVDDVGFIDKLIDALVAEHGADPARVYVTGHSNGGMLAYRLACRLPGKIAGIAPVGAPVREDTCEGADVPILVIHGEEDPCAAYGGGAACGGCFQRFLGLPAGKGDNIGACLSVPRHVNKWRKAHKCRTGAKRSGDKPLKRLSYNNCRKPVVFDSVRGHGHGWPGLTAEDSSPACRRRPDGMFCRRWLNTIGPYAGGYDASREIVDFFMRGAGGNGASAAQ